MTEITRVTTLEITEIKTDPWCFEDDWKAELLIRYQLDDVNIVKVQDFERETTKFEDIIISYHNAIDSFQRTGSIYLLKDFENTLRRVLRALEQKGEE